MHYYFVLLLLKKTFIFWSFNFIVGFPFVFYFKNKIQKNIIGINQFTAIALISIILFWIKFLNININTISTIIYISLCSITISIFLIIHSIKNKSFKNVYKKVIEILRYDIYQYLIYALFVFIIVSPQKIFPPFIPSYEVNHDPIFSIFASKNIFEHQQADLQIRNSMFENVKDTSYPLGFISLLNIFHILFSMDYYETSHFLNILIYSISFTYLSVFIVNRIKTKIAWLAYIASFLGLLSYLPIQYVNQSFYASISLTPFLLAIIFYIYEFFHEEKNISYPLMIISITAAITMYSLTVFLWIFPLSLILYIYKILNKKTHLDGKRILTSSLISGFLCLPFLAKSLKLFYNAIFIDTRGSEASFFGAIGNMYGYPSILTSVSSWFSNDYRISDGANPYKHSIYFFIVLICFIFLSVFLFKKFLIKKYNIDFLFMLPMIIFTWIFAIFILKSPYYFGKTLFYSSILLTSFIYLITLVMVFHSKNIFAIIFGTAIIVIMANNSIISIGHFGQPPIDKFLAIRIMNIEMKKDGINNLVIIDDEDWLKYFLYDLGSCVTYARTSPCGLETIERFKDDKITLKDHRYYLIGKKYKDEVTVNNSFEIILKNNYYTLLKN